MKKYNGIFKKRRKLEYTQAEVSKALYMGSTTYQRKESGIGEFTLSEAVELAKVLDLEGADEVHELVNKWY